MDGRYYIADVFTDVPFGGNPLAVFLDGAELETRQMQAIAREMNLSETTFVTPGSAEGHFRVRIFTPAHEAAVRRPPDDRHRGGPGEHRRDRHALGDRAGGRRRSGARHAPQSRGDAAPRGRAGRAGLHGGSRGRGPCARARRTAIAAPPWLAGYGVPYVFIALIDVAAVSGSALRADRWEALGVLPADPYVFAITGQGDDRVALHARMFAPAHGIVEDPATGSAAAALAGSIRSLKPDNPKSDSVKSDSPKSDSLRSDVLKLGGANGGGRGDAPFRLTIAQGVEMGRPSRIETETYYEGAHVAGISVGGGAVIVGEGRLRHLP